MNISATFNVGDLITYIEDKDEDNEDLRENSLQGRVINPEQAAQSNLLNYIKTLARIRAVVTYELNVQ